MKQSAVDLWTKEITQAQTPRQLEAWQMNALRRQLRHAQKGRFQRTQLQDITIDDLQTYADLDQIPLCSKEDIEANPYDFCCIPPGKVARIRTIRTSGTTGVPKRVLFSENDLESTVEFFRIGLSCLMDSSDRLLILMPAQLPWSVGDCIKKAVDRIGAEYIENGPVVDYNEAICKARRATAIVGIPAQVYRMAKLAPKLRPKSVLLSADYVPASVIKLIQNNWKTEVFVHYGLTESGLGGGVECGCHTGCHMRHPDLLFEIIDPETGRRVPDGTLGELVFSTLSREAMPLIRYRTGDLALRTTDPCACGSCFPRIDRFEGRISSTNAPISIHQLDEEIFSREGVLDYTAHWDKGELILEVLGDIGTEPIPFPVTVHVRQGAGFLTNGTLKRRLHCKEDIDWHPDIHSIF